MRTSTSEPRGQVVVIVAVAFTVMLALLAVLFDGANGMVTRREMQDAGDAAAISASNLIQVGSPRGCSATPGGAPRAAVAQAARDSLAANLEWFDASTAVITCPAGYENQAIAIELGATSARFFGGMVGGDIQVNTRSAAVNRVITGSRYSIVQLDPGHQSWPNGQRGCPSVLLSGGPTVILQATMQVNSTCTAANGGALSTNGSGGSLTMTNGAPIRVVGGYSAGSMSITPAPTTGVAAIPDPLAKLPPVDVANTPLIRSTRLVLSNTTQVLQPGRYQGGIELRNSSVALLLPGIYVIQGGGLQIGAQASVLSVRAGVTTPGANWGNDCPANACGVMIYNTTGATALGQLSVAAGSTLRLRAYDPDAVPGGGVADFENILVWQDANPVPTSTYAQPIVQLNGGGNVDIRGTVYAPSAKVEMGGNSGGSGGDAVNLTLQFISWDLEFRGNSAFTFFFNDEEFARPIDYGLVE
ncbi:MAG TPA: Tad domain-containing protein [Candidatus Limnocylindrales bacterium]|nr:Tad domain-containing protein [Candidatus Limnocylindrales bacterium]